MGQKPLPLSLKRWDAVVRPVALPLFAACWDGMPAFPVIEETARALLTTVLHVVAAVPCLLLPSETDRVPLSSNCQG